MVINRIPSSPPKIDPVNGLEQPFWSVMIPVYNCTSYIQEALESVLLQDKGAANMQIEVVDDCSTDGDVEALVLLIGNGRVSYFKQPENKGSLRNFETCINRARGKYIHLLHGDDRVEVGFYNEIAGLFDIHPQAGAAFTNFSYIDYRSATVNITNKKIQKTQGIITDFLYKIAEKQLIQPPAIVVKRSTYESLGGYYAVHFGEDWEMWTRIASKYPIAYSPKHLASYRVGHGIGISYKSFLTGQNIIDITTVINTIQNYLPVEKRAKLKKASFSYYARYCVKIANGLLLQHKTAAFIQLKGAWKMDKSIITIYWILRFYIMYLFRYKEIEQMLRSKNFKKYEPDTF